MAPALFLISSKADWGCLDQAAFILALCFFFFIFGFSAGALVAAAGSADFIGAAAGAAGVAGAAPACEAAWAVTPVKAQAATIKAERSLFIAFPLVGEKNSTS